MCGTHARADAACGFRVAHVPVCFVMSSSRASMAVLCGDAIDNLLSESTPRRDAPRAVLRALVCVCVSVLVLSRARVSVAAWWRTRGGAHVQVRHLAALPEHARVFQLLRIFANEKLEAYAAFYEANKEFVGSIGTRARSRSWAAARPPVLVGPWMSPWCRARR